MKYFFLETRAPNFTTNSVHIADDEGNAHVTVWEIDYRGQDDLWERAQSILDFLNQKEHDNE